MRLRSFLVDDQTGKSKRLRDNIRTLQPYPSGKGTDCKSAMHQFESGWLLTENRRTHAGAPVFYCPHAYRLIMKSMLV